MEPKTGYVILVRLKKQTGIPQGTWAFGIRPDPDDMSSIRPRVVPAGCAPDDIRQGKCLLPDEMLFFGSNHEAEETAEKFAESNYIYQMTGDFEIIKVKQKAVTIYRGYEVVT